MEKKPFIIIFSILVFTFLATTAIKHFRFSPTRNATLENIPLSKGGWSGQMETTAPEIINLLGPDQLFSASFSNTSGQKVHLFIDYFSPENTSGNIHSPRNCLPGSGWVITGSAPREIVEAKRTIHALRLSLKLGESRQVMDFWYITRAGETGNDYMLKLNTMISSLTLRPTDKAFVRFVAADDAQSIAALNEFESIFIDDIYKHLPF
jgi:EpsI family protein